MADQAMMSSSPDELSLIDKAVLAPPVRRALGSDSLEVTDWGYERLYGGVNDKGTGIAGVFRFAGSGQDGGDTRAWSLILKIIDPATQPDRQRARREWLAYQSGLLNGLSGNLVAPRCFDATEKSNRMFWLWLEEVYEMSGARWPLERYGVAARHLGQFNGSYLENRPVLAKPWLREKDWLRSTLRSIAPVMAQLQTFSDDPQVNLVYPPSAVAELARLWDERELFLSVLDRLPPTLCHHDAHRRNLFARQAANGHEQTVLIDWDLVGHGVIGQELVALVQISLLAFDVELAQARQLDELVFESYVLGLQDMGWRGDPQAVRFGYAATSALYHGLGFTVPALDILLAIDETKQAVMERAFGRRMGEIIEQCAGHVGAALALTGEARALLPRLTSGILPHSWR